MHNDILSFEYIGKLPACEIVKLICDNKIKKIEFEAFTKHITTETAKAVIEEIKDIQIDFICASIENDYTSENKLSESERKRLDEAERHLTSWIEAYNEPNYYKTGGDKRQFPEALNNDKAKSVLQRFIKAGYLKADFMPEESTGKTDLYLICLYAGTELKIENKWKAFGQLWQIQKLQQSAREWQIKESRKKRIQSLFDKKVIDDAKIKQ